MWNIRKTTIVKGKLEAKIEQWQDSFERLCGLVNELKRDGFTLINHMGDSKVAFNASPFLRTFTNDSTVIIIQTWR